MSYGDQTSTSLELTHLRGRVYIYPEAEKNIVNIVASIGDDGVLLVDTKYLKHAEAIESALKAKTDKSLRYVVNTHWHTDHTEGNKHFHSSASIIAHENVRDRLTQRSYFVGTAVDAFPEYALPDWRFTDSLTFPFNGEDISLIHLPNGHTDGDAVVYFRESNVIATGDQFFNRRLPIIDITSGGHVRQFTANLQTIIELIDDETIVVPGHGPVGKRSDVIEFKKGMDSIIAVVSAGLKSGESYEDLKDRGAVDRFTKEWEARFLTYDIFLAIVYSDLSGQPLGELLKE